MGLGRAFLLLSPTHLTGPNQALRREGLCLLLYFQSAQQVPVVEIQSPFVRGAERDYFKVRSLGAEQAWSNTLFQDQASTVSILPTSGPGSAFGEKAGP